MKQKDILLIVVVLFVAGIFSFIITNFLFGSPSQKKLEAEYVDKIQASFSAPDKRYFNEQSINPTQLISIDKQNNQQPF